MQGFWGFNSKAQGLGLRDAGFWALTLKLRVLGLRV